MTIEIVPDVTEISTPEDFMARFVEALGESDEMGDDVKLIITTMHRDLENQAHVNLAFSVNEGEQFCTSLPLTADAVLEIADILIKREHCHMSPFALQQFENIMLSIFSAEVDHRQESLMLAKAISEAAAYQGGLTEIILCKLSDGTFDLELNIYSEYFHDTSAEEIKFLEAKGLAHLHRAASPNRRALMMSLKIPTIQQS